MSIQKITMEYYAAIKKNEVALFTWKLKDCQDILFSEKKQGAD